MIIAIGSVGGLTGHYLAKIFREKYPDAWILGLDAVEAGTSEKYLNEFQQVPSILEDEIKYVETLSWILNEYKIEYYLPTHSKETKTVSKHEVFLRKNCRANFIISPYTTFQALDEKDRGNRSLKAVGIRVPEIYSNDSVIFPAFIKPREGSGSKDSYKINNESELKAYRLLFPNCIVMEYIKGVEYTVDALFDGQGALLLYNQRVRKKQLGGATIYTYNDYSVDVGSQIEKISSHYPCKGVVNFQFILNNEEAYFTDVNLRYASGGLPLSVYSGMDIAEILPRLIDGKKVEKGRYSINRDRIVMRRYFEERFTAS